MIETATMPRTATLPPFFADIPEFRRMIGGIGKTAAYELIDRHKVQVVKVGSRSMIPFAEVERVRDELMKAADQPAPAKGGRVLAASSVEARRARKSNASK
jgi:hypothetical protein